MSVRQGPGFMDTLTRLPEAASRSWRTFRIDDSQHSPDLVTMQIRCFGNLVSKFERLSDREDGVAISPTIAVGRVVEVASSTASV